MNKQSNTQGASKESTVLVCGGGHRRGVNVWPSGRVGFSNLTFVGCEDSALHLIAQPLDDASTVDDGSVAGPPPAPPSVSISQCAFREFHGTAIFANGQPLTVVISDSEFQATADGHAPEPEASSSGAVLQSGAVVAISGTGCRRKEVSALDWWG